MEEDSDNITSSFNFARARYYQLYDKSPAKPSSVLFFIYKIYHSLLYGRVCACVCVCVIVHRYECIMDFLLQYLGGGVSQNLQSKIYLFLLFLSEILYTFFHFLPIFTIDKASELSRRENFSLRLAIFYYYYFFSFLQSLKILQLLDWDFTKWRREIFEEFRGIIFQEITKKKSFFQEKNKKYIGQSYNVSKFGGVPANNVFADVSCLQN